MFGADNAERHRQLRRRHAGRPNRRVHAGHARQRQPGAGRAVRRVPLLEHRCLRAGQLEGEARTSPSSTACASATGPTTQELSGLGGYFDPSLYDPIQGLVPRSRARIKLVNGDLLRLHRLRRPPASSRTAVRSRCRASTWRGTSTARATTSSAAATACSTTATWATSNTTTPCGWRPTPTRSSADVWAGGDYGNGAGLTYDTVQRGDARQPHRHARRSTRSTRTRSRSRRRTASACRTRGASSSTRCVEAQLRRHARP